MSRAKFQIANNEVLLQQFVHVRTKRSGQQCAIALIADTFNKTTPEVGFLSQSEVGVQHGES